MKTGTNLRDQSRKTLLLVEDQAIIAMAEAAVLERRGYRVRLAHSFEAAIDAARDEEIDLVLMDIDLGAGEPDGTATAQAILAAREVPIVFLTNHGEQEMVERVAGITRYGYVLKDAGEHVLVQAIEMALQLFATVRQLMEMTRRADASRVGRFEGVLRAADMAWWELSLPSGTVVFDDNKARMLGFPPERFRTYRDFADLLHPDDYEATMEAMRLHLSGDKDRYRSEYRIRTSDGGYRRLRDVGAVTERNPETGELRVFGIVIDISAWLSGDTAEHYLKEELYRLVQSDPEIFEFLQAGSLDGIWYWDLERQDQEWMSRRFWEVIGHDPEGKAHSPSEWQDLINPDDLAVALTNFQKHLADAAHPYDQVVRYRRADGGTTWVRCRGIAIRDAEGRPLRMLGAHNDITELKEAERLLRESVAQLEQADKDKRVLLREMHHRVKNSLLTVRTLLSLKAEQVGPGMGFEEVMHQVEAIRLIHETLQENATVSEIVVQDYLASLVSGVFESQADTAVSVLGDDSELTLSIERALPLGLVLNELATNALKHGFRGGGPHRFTVQYGASDGALELDVSNSGPAIPDEVDVQNPTTTGLRLVSDLMGQIRGSWSVERAPHPRFLLRLPL